MLRKPFPSPKFPNETVVKTFLTDVKLVILKRQVSKLLKTENTSKPFGKLKIRSWFYACFEEIAICDIFPYLG
jgi:hypothetical protein